MSCIISLSPFLSGCVLVCGVHYDNKVLIISGVLLFMISFFALLNSCGSGLMDEIERANKRG
jgi:hypothetical protein